VEVSGLRGNEVEGAVEIHIAAMPDFFLTSLGPSFLRVYYSQLLQDKSAIAVAARDSTGELIGVTVGSTNPAHFYGDLLQRAWWRFGAAAIPGVTRSPSSAIRVLRALRYPSTQPEGSHLAGLYSIAVRPSAQGMGAGRAMTRAFLQEAALRGSWAVYLHADSDGNDGWNALLRSMGWQLEKTFSTPEGRMMNEYWFALEGDSNAAR